MPDVLFRGIDNTISDKTREAKTCYGIGDIVHVSPIGTAEGKRIVWPNFGRIRVEDSEISLLEMKRFMQAGDQKRRKYKINLSTFTARQLQILQQDKWLTLDRLEFLAAIEDTQVIVRDKFDDIPELPKRSL